MSEKTMWMVRAGEDAFLFDDFKKKSIIAIGWNDAGNLNNIPNLSELKSIIAKKYPNYKQGKIFTTANQLYKFKSDFEKGDKVVTYDPDARVYLVGEIISDYIHDEKLLKYHNLRKVKWINEVSRDVLSTSTKNTLGAISTIFEVNERAETEILNIASGKKVDVLEEPEENVEEIKQDIASQAHEFIKDRIHNLDWEDSQKLVAGVLRSMGYKTLVSDKGSDRGKDIVASPDGLGLEEPRIKVEVKHRSGSMGAPEIRSFIGGLRQGVKGLYISTGGFSKEAKYEAERSNIPITLIDLDMLAELVTKNYDNFDIETKALIPLEKIYWPLE